VADVTEKAQQLMRNRKEKQMAKPKTRDWTVTDDGTVVCYASEKSHCVVTDSNSAFATVSELTVAHDEDLAQATKEINRILAAVIKKKKRNKRHLCILVTHKGPLLAWTKEGVTNDSDEKEVEKALKLR
jgi:hypothetical protein